MESNRIDIQLLRPDIKRDAIFALSWFDRSEGRQTLISMGNAEHEIKPTTLEDEKITLSEFIKLEKEEKQITRMIVADNKTIGAVWIELFSNHGVKPPSIHIMIGNPDYRGKGIGRSVMEAAIDYINHSLHQNIIYSRHLISNQTISLVSSSLGFKPDGAAYTDKNNLVWQNIKLTIH